MTDDSWAVAPSSEKPVKYIRRLWWSHLSAKKTKPTCVWKTGLWWRHLSAKKKKKKWQAHVCVENRFCVWKTGFECIKPVLCGSRSPLFYLLKRPSYLYEKIRCRNDEHNLDIRHKFTIRPPAHTSVGFEGSLSFSIARLYNKIPVDLKFYTGIKFKLAVKRIITHLI